MDPEFIRDLFSKFGPVTVKRMFSGAGIFADGLMFGLIVDGAIHFKVGETNIADFEREGSRPFTYTRGKSSAGPRATRCPIGACRSGSTMTPMSLRFGRPARLPSRTQKIGASPRAKRKPSVREVAVHKKLCGSTSISSLIEPCFFGAAANHWRK